MINPGWISRLLSEKHSLAAARRIVGGMAATILGLTASTAVAQVPIFVSHPTAPDGYALHESIDLGGHVANVDGSGAMYDTLVNQQSGPRILGDTYELRALPNTKNTLFDHLKAFTSGLGGDPNDIAKLDFSKGKLYEFSGLFRRDRQYFDYDLLGNPNLPPGQSIPIGPPATPTGSYAWPQVMQSPFTNNSVRRMTDTNLTLLPLSKVTFRVGYAQNVFQGPSLTPSGYFVGGYNDLLLQEYQRNSTDDWTGSVEWKPVSRTRLTYEEQVTHYKGDSTFSMAPQYFNLQEANGLRVAVLQSYDNPINSPVGISCNPGVGTAPISPAQTPNGLPIVDPACNVVTSYSRSQPTREIFPTEIFRLQSSSIKNVTMNGNIRYTNANTSLANYYDDFQGLAGTNRETTYAGNARAKRETIATDYGVTWQALKKLSISEQIDYSNVHQPGFANITSLTTVTAATPNINSTALTTTVFNTPINPNTGKPTPTFEGSPSVATPLFDFFGQKFITNNLTAAYDVTDRAVLTLTWHHQQHDISEGAANTTGYLSGISNFTIHENGGTFGVAVQPANNWHINGSVEVLYADNVLTPVAPRELQHYRIHTTYRPKTWATFSGAYNDLERHNNTNNTGTASVDGPLQHVDHSRILSLNADLMPNEHYGFDVGYAYSGVYTATNICFQGTAAGPGIPGAATPTGTACPSPTPRVPGSAYTFGPAKDFMNAPTQYASVALALSPIEKFHANIGYRISSVNGSRFFNDPRDVNGSLVSTYQTPFVNLSYAMRKDLIWKGEYGYYGYGEGGPSGAQYCNPSSTLPLPGNPAPVVPCSTLPNTAMSGPAYGFTAPRSFHANNVTLGVHYEF
ncbi:MAG: hypothetical protein WCA92_08215 [Terriglobales bacterium]|jgi:hypothetical protein